jgi:hypothetical protein
VTPSAVVPPTEPLLTIDPKTIPVPYTLKPDAPSYAAEYWKECEQEKIKRITESKERLDLAISTLRDYQRLIGGHSSDDQLIKSEQDDIETARSKLKEVCDPDCIVDSPMWDAETGPGVIHGTIIQIVDDQNMLVDIDFSYYHSIGEHETVWISGYSTQDQVDGSPVVDCFIPAGRMQYESAMGKRTVHLFKPFNIRDYLIMQ